MPEELHISVRSEDGSLWATVKEFPGVFATGDTVEELRQSLEEGIALSIAEPGEPTPEIKLEALQPAELGVANAHLEYA